MTNLNQLALLLLLRRLRLQEHHTAQHNLSTPHGSSSFGAFDASAKATTFILTLHLQRQISSSLVLQQAAMGDRQLQHAQLGNYLVDCKVTCD